MTDPRLPHHDHDPLLIAAHVADDLPARDREAVARLLRDCDGCSTLEADLRAVAQAVADLPTPTRTRDFTLSPEDVARLRPTGWRRWLHTMAGPRFALAGPLGATFASLGVAGLLLASAPAINLGGSAGPLPAGTDAATYDTAAPAAQGGGTGGATEVDNGLRSNGSVEPVTQAPGQPAASGPLDESDGSSAVTDAEAVQRAADGTLAILSGSFLIVGLGLYGLRWTARRLGDG